MQPPEQHPVSPHEQEQTTVGERIRVHVLSDDPRVRDSARSLPPNFEVTYSVDKWEALRAISESARVGVIELDLGGFGIATEVRQRVPDRNRLSIVMLCSRPHDRWMCLQAGADEVLIKPLNDTDALRKSILKLANASVEEKTG